MRLALPDPIEAPRLRLCTSERRRLEMAASHGGACATEPASRRNGRLLVHTQGEGKDAGVATRRQAFVPGLPMPRQEHRTMALRGGAEDNVDGGDDVVVVDDSTTSSEASVSHTSGNDPARNLVPWLERCIEQDRRRRSRGFLSSHVQHSSCVPGQDMGWGCGWRNIQMMCSYLLHRDECAAEALCFGLGRIPSIGELQDYLEMAWDAGFDVEGARQLGNRVKGTAKWIGTTECAALLRLFGFRARIADFRITGSNKESLLDWVWSYFSQGRETDPHLPTVVCFKSPLYFQHEGHSRTIIGVEKLTRPPSTVEETSLLVLDPNVSMQSIHNALESASGWQQLLRRGINTLKDSEYQLLWVDHGIALQEEKEGLKIMRATEHHGF